MFRKNKKLNLSVRKNRRGWIMIVEAFIGILLISEILVISLNNPNIKRGDPYEKIYLIENGILEEVQLNNTLRANALDVTPPISSDELNFPNKIEDTINLRKPDYLNCTERICLISDACDVENLPDEDIYVASTVITASLTKYSPRELKLFCWENP